MERLVADYLAATVDDRIDRMRQTGAKDLGDIGGMRIAGQRVAIEVKNTSKINLAGWAAEAEVERGNQDGLAGITVHKRHGKTAPDAQWVTMTLGDFVALITASREHYENPPVEDRDAVRSGDS